MGSMVFEWSKDLSSTNRKNRSRAAKALADAPDWEKKAAVAALENALKRESTPNVRDDIVNALASLGVRAELVPVGIKPYLKCRECGRLLLGGTTKCPKCASRRIQEFTNATPGKADLQEKAKEEQARRAVDAPDPGRSVEALKQRKGSWFSSLFGGRSQQGTQRLQSLLRPGELLLDRYLIESQIGEGTFGRVYLASDRHLSRKVAIKELRSRFLGNGEMTCRFVNEARMAASLQHPSIVTVHDLQPVDSPRYIVMEYLQGGSLRRQLQECGNLEIGHALQVTIAILEALSQVHEKKMVHRDIKPENVLFSAGDVLKISDFGIATFFEGGIAGTPRSSEGQTGTPLYMAPEQVTGQGTDARTDLYAVGVVLYEMLTGAWYCDASNIQDIEQVVYAVVNLNPVKPSERNHALPAALDDILLRMLAKRPELRYTNAMEVISALQTIGRGGQDSGSTRTRRQEADEWFNDGKRYADSGNFDMAFLRLGQCLMTCPDHPEARGLLTRAYCKSHRDFVYPKFWNGDCKGNHFGTLMSGRCPTCYSRLMFRF